MNRQSRKTVAIVTNSTWNVYNFRRELVTALAEAGYRVVIFAPFDSSAGALEKIAPVELYDVPLDKRGISPVKDLRYLWRLYRLMGSVRPDLVLNFVMKPLIYGSWAAHLRRVPVISTQTGLGTAYLRGGIVARISLLLYRSAYRGRARKVLFHNRDDLEFFVERGIVDSGQADVVPGSGIDLGRFVPPQMPEEGSRPLQVLFVARLIADKGIREFLDAVEMLHRDPPRRTVRFAVLGSAVEDTDLNRRIKTRVETMAREGKLDYLGYREDADSVMAEADIVVMPSYREGTSRVLLEAAALEKPVVSTDVPGCRNVIRDGMSGLLARPKDAEDLCAKIRTLVESGEERRREMGRAGRRYVAEVFEVEHVVRRYLDYVRSELGT